jgi:hypothetical protein
LHCQSLAIFPIFQSGPTPDITTVNCASPPLHLHFLLNKSAADHHSIKITTKAPWEKSGGCRSPLGRPPPRKNQLRPDQVGSHLRSAQITTLNHSTLNLAMIYCSGLHPTVTFGHFRSLPVTRIPLAHPPCHSLSLPDGFPQVLGGQKVHPHLNWANIWRPGAVNPPPRHA